MIPEDDEAPLIGAQLSVYHSLHKKQGGTAVDSVPDIVSGGSRDTNFKLLAMQGVFLILRNLLFLVDHRKTPFKNLFK